MGTEGARSWRPMVQELGEAPWMSNVAHWGVLTIGTGLGNACFSTRVPRPTDNSR